MRHKIGFVSLKYAEYFETYGSDNLATCTEIRLKKLKSVIYIVLSKVSRESIRIYLLQFNSLYLKNIMQFSSWTSSVQKLKEMSEPRVIILSEGRRSDLFRLFSRAERSSSSSSFFLSICSNEVIMPTRW